MRVYTTQDGDVLDALCYAEYGAEHGTTEVVLAMNPVLAGQPVVLPAGVVIQFPIIEKTPPVQNQIQLWD